jgi:hypothetical protein
MDDLLYTGLMPEKHGLEMRKVRDMLKDNANPPEMLCLQTVNCRKFRGSTLMKRIRHRHVRRLGTFPAPEINGFVVSGELLFGYDERAFSPLI